MKTTKILVLAAGALMGLTGLVSVAQATSFYAIQNNGDLKFYKHSGTYNGAPTWPVKGKKIGAGWLEQADTTFAGPDGSIYVIRPNGALSFYRHSGTDNGAATFPVQNVSIGSGWNDNSIKVFAGDAGSIYVLRSNGDLDLYKFTGTYNGAHTPANWPVQNLKIGVGWNIFSTVVAGENGTLYGIKPDGDLLFYRHTEPYNGVVNFIVSGALIGSGWNSFDHVFTGDDGSIYGIQANGNIRYYKYTGQYDGSPFWPVSNKLIGNFGWNLLPKVFTSSN
jgi:hypothetical protein